MKPLLSWLAAPFVAPRAAAASSTHRGNVAASAPQGNSAEPLVDTFASDDGAAASVVVPGDAAKRWWDGTTGNPNLRFEPSARSNISSSPVASVAPRGSAALVDRFGELLPFVDFDPDRRLFLLEANAPGKYEGLGYTLEIAPQTGASEALANAMTNLITASCPPGTGIQVGLFASPRIDGYLESIYRSCVDPDEVAAKVRDPSLRGQMVSQALIFRDLMARRCQYLARGAMQELHEGSNLRFRDFRGYLSVVFPCTTPKNPGALRDVLSLRQSHVTTLQQYGLYAGTWGIEEFLHFMSTVLNPHRMMRGDNPALFYDPTEEPRYQIIAPDTQISVEESRIDFFSQADRSDAMSAVCMSVRSFPPYVSMQSMSNVLGALDNTTNTYPCPYLITVGVTVPDYEAVKNLTQVKAAAAQRNADLPYSRYMPHLAEVNADWKIAQRAFEEGKGTVRMYAQTTLFAPPGEQQRVEEIARAVWRGSLFELTNDTLMQTQGLLACLPMLNGPLLSNDLKRARRSSTKTSFNAANMMPLVAEWRGTPLRENDTRPYPILPLIGRRGQVMPVDPFANPTGNPNAIVVGSSGSGKSVLMNELACGVLRTGGRVWIIDIGFSYKKLCEALGGQYIEFTEDCDICLNPFSMVEDIGRDIEVLKAIVVQMLSLEGKIDPYEAAQLELHLQDVWLNQGRSATITHLAESLKNNCELGGPNPRSNDPEWREHVLRLSAEERSKICDPRIRDLGVQLFPFTADGNYGRHFNGPCNIRFTSNFVVLELEQLKAKPHLQAVVMMTLMKVISEAIYLTPDRSLRKAVLLDEAWALLREGDAARFIEDMYRRIRKYGGLVATATQSLADYEAPSARAAFANADVSFLLMQKKSSIDHASRHGMLGLTEHQTAELASVTKVPKQYAEVYVKVGDCPATVGRLIVDPFTLLLYSSHPDDIAAIARHRARGLGVVEAIEAVLRERGQTRTEEHGPGPRADDLAGRAAHRAPEEAGA